MHYLWWHVPHLTAPMLIALVATIHVIVSHYAVGGGLFLAVEVGYAHQKQDREYLDYLKRHTLFFVLLTVVFGAITGVGIWWTIGLASPLATEVLIRTFVFGWAMEYVSFIVELVAAFVFYYYWNRLTARTHTAVGWIYAVAAWISLVLISAITAFMLAPGEAWFRDRGNFWAALFNPQALPQIIARTGGALLLASLYVYLHDSIIVKPRRLNDLIQRRSSRPALLGAVLVTIGGVLWYVFLPESAKATLGDSAVLTIFMGLIFAVTVAVFFLLYLGPFRNPGWLTPGFAAALLILGVVAMGTGEFIREAVRKPYVVYNVVFGNQVLPEEVRQLRTTGFLDGGTWTRAYVARQYPQVMQDGHISGVKLLQLPAADREAVGAVLFQYHCNDCHAAAMGYSPAGPMLRGRSREMIRALVEHLDLAHYFMPPWAGTAEEAEVLTDYLLSITSRRPTGMAPGHLPAGGGTSPQPAAAAPSDRPASP